MAAEDLKSLSDEKLQAVIDDATRILDERKTAKRHDAIEAAREVLAAAGMTFRDVAKEAVVKGMKRVQQAATEQVERFVHPQTGEVWVPGRGRRPKWVATLLEGGKQDDARPEDKDEKQH
jgi:DNA-binding protein H-NS